MAEDIYKISQLRFNKNKGVERKVAEYIQNRDKEQNRLIKDYIMSAVLAYEEQKRDTTAVNTVLEVIKSRGYDFKLLNPAEAKIEKEITEEQVEATNPVPVKEEKAEEELSAETVAFLSGLGQ